MAFNRKQKLRDNIEAIRTAFILDRENRTATTEERAILQRYCGFGGLKCILNPAKELTDAVRWAKSDLELFAPTVELHRLIRENSKDETEYKRFVDSLKASVLTAFYTPGEITGTIADVLADYGVRPARVLEPSAGVGAFVDAVLRHSPDADVMAFEKDLLTGTILRQLYPDKKMRIDGFEKIEKPFSNYFDLAVSNIPFGDIAVFDAEFQRSESFGRRSAQKTIHNYFFLKGLDTVRDGGIVAFITSQGVLNSAKTSVRNELFSQANLISAIRLPNNLFSDNAGTEVGSDLIILQKNLHKTEMSQDERLLTVIQTDTKTNLTDNAYFIHHPERIVHTTAKLDTDPYGKPAMVYLHEGKTAGIAGDLRRMLDEDCHFRLAMRLYSGAIGQARERLAVEAKVEPQTAKLETVSSARAEEIHVDKPQTQPIKEKPEIEPRQQNHSAAVQLHGRGKQFEVGFRPVDGIRQFPCRVQNTFQPSETAILLKYRPFFGCSLPLFPVKDECRPYRLDVVPQPLFAVKRHIPLYKGRQPPSAPCRAGRNRATGRNCRPRGHRWRIRFRQAAAVSG